MVHNLTVLVGLVLLTTQGTQIRERKKAKQKEHPNPPLPQKQPPAEWGDCLSSALAGASAVTQPHPQKATSLQPLVLTIHLNVSLNTASYFLPSIERQEDLISLASLHSCPHYSTASEDEIALSPGCQQINQGISSRMSWINAHLPHQDQECCSKQRQRSSSNGYLIQMEKQKQLRMRVTYKNLKRQKLYSNVIRKQNKKISGIPFLLAKDPEGNASKVPRMKALEYAKTMAKSPVQFQPRQKQKYQSKGFPEHASDLDVPQMAVPEALRKRHKEEKQAVSFPPNAC
ncbi:jhy protein homolog [Spinachia spinachia]